MKKLTLPILSIITLATAGISLALRIISLFFFYDKLGYYQNGAILPIASNIFLALALVLLLVASIFSIDKKRRIFAPDKISQYAALLPLGASIFTAIRAIMGSLDASPVNKFLFLISSALAGVFFILIYLKKQPFIPAVYFGLGAIIHVFLLWFHSYFDFRTPLNSTDKIFYYLACAGAILFIFEEICVCFGEVRARLYYFSLFASVIILWVASVSALVGYAFGVIEKYFTLDGDIFFITLAIYATTRLIMLAKSPNWLIVDKNDESKEEAAQEETTINEEENNADGRE